MKSSSYAKKKVATTYKSELHAISHLPVETIRERLQAIGDKQVDVFTLPVTDDMVEFEVSNLCGERMNATVYGTIQRWQGTYSRMDADSHTYIRWAWLNLAATLIVWLLLFGLIFTFLMMLISLSPGAGWQFGFVLSLIVSLGIITYMPDIDFFVEETYQARKDVDYLMQEIANALSAHTTADTSSAFVEFDGSDDVLSQLLQTYSGNVQVGHDGEITHEQIKK